MSENINGCINGKGHKNKGRHLNLMVDRIKESRTS